MTCHSGRCNLVYVVILCRIPSDALLQVEHQLCLLCICTEGIALESGTLGGSELHILVGMPDEDLRLVAIGYWQECHVAQVTDTGTAEVLMTETDEYGVRVMITGTPVPAT